MSADDRRRWDQRYDGASVASASPPDALVAGGLLDALPASGRALDVACGRGAQSVWLAQRGLDVVAVDVSPRAIETTAEAARRAGVGERVRGSVADLDDGLPHSIGDPPVSLDGLAVIVCQRFRAPQLYPTFVERLRPGGIGVVTVLSRVGAASPGEFHAPTDELTGFFAERSEVLWSEQGDGRASIVFRV